MKTKYLLIAFLIFYSCKGRKVEETVMSDQELTEHLTNANMLRVQKESQEIDEFITRHQFKTEKTGTGLRIEIYDKKDIGSTPQLHDTVTMICKVYLLDGTLCYESDSTNAIQFRLGEGVQVRGLEEGIMKMKPKEQARLIIPNHLAYGLSGDGEKIPPAAALYIDIKLLKVGK